MAPRAVLSVVEEMGRALFDKIKAEIEDMPGVEGIEAYGTSWKLASREFRGERTTITIGRQVVGGGETAVIAGPCAVESREAIIEIAEKIQPAGAAMLRGGAFKPRTSPYSFRGLGEEGLKYLREASDLTACPW